MGFADELRNAHEVKAEEQKQHIEDKKELEKLLLDLIKKHCKYFAENSRNECTVYIKDLIDYFENEYTNKYSIGLDDTMEIEFYNYKEALLWERLRNMFFHYININSKMYNDKIYNYPPVFGMSKENAKKLSFFLKKQLVDEGLTVEVMLHKEYLKCHYEEQFIEYNSKLDKILSGKDGYYKKICIEDEQMYSFNLKISW